MHSVFSSETQNTQIFLLSPLHFCVILMSQAVTFYEGEEKCIGNEMRKMELETPTLSEIPAQSELLKV